MLKQKSLVVYTKAHIFKVFELLYQILAWPFRSAVFICGYILNFFLDKAKSIFLKIIFLSVILVALGSSAVLLYATFYNFYIPTAEIKRPVHLTFTVCSSRGVGVCSFPSGNVTFWNDEGTIQEVLTVGQAYTVDVELEMPDSPVNRELGMFLVSVKMYDRTGQVSLTTQRSAMVRYRSIVLRMLDLLLWIPFYFMGLLEQKHSILINMFTHYVDDYYHPSAGATVEVHNHKIEIYSATITFSAKFSGLKYLLYHWPLISGFFAFGVNIFFLALGLAVASYQRTETLSNISAAVQLTESTKKFAVKDEQKTFVSSSTMTDDKTAVIKPIKEDVKLEPGSLPLIQEPADFTFPLETTETEVVQELRQRRGQH